MTASKRKPKANCRPLISGWLAALAIGGCGIGVPGCGSGSSAQPQAAKMVYIDMATMKPLVHEVAASFPAAHPQTGKHTLRPALYCTKCQAWYPISDSERLNRRPGAGLCPKDKTPLTADGPWPDENSPSQTNR